jgi:hypothetical protein
MHALLSLLTEAVTYMAGKRWQGFVAVAIVLLLIWFIILMTR